MLVRLRTGDPDHRPPATCGCRRAPRRPARSASIPRPWVRSPSPAASCQSARGRSASHGAADDRQTVAQRVAAVEALPDQRPAAWSCTRPTSGRYPWRAAASSPRADPVQTTLTAQGSYVTGSLQRRAGQLRLRVTPTSVPYKGAVRRARDALRDRRRDDRGSLPRGRRRAVRRSRSRRSTATPDGRGGAAFTRRLERLDGQRAGRGRMGRRRHRPGRRLRGPPWSSASRSRCAPGRPRCPSDPRSSSAPAWRRARSARRRVRTQGRERAGA